MEKQGVVNLSVNASSKTPKVETKIQFSSLDTGSAKLIFNVMKDGVALPLSSAQGYLDLRMADWSTFSELPVKIRDAAKGVMEYSLTAEQLKHTGMAQAELSVVYENGQSMSISKFEFKIDKAIRDQDIVVKAQHYIKDIEDLKRQIESTADSIGEMDIVRINEKLTELEGKVGEGGAGVDEQARQGIEGLTEQLAEKAQKEVAESAHLRIDELVIESGNANAEVTDAHVSTAKNKTFTTVRNRFEEIESFENQTSIKAKNMMVNGSFTGSTNGWAGLRGTVTYSDGTAVLLASEANAQVRQGIARTEGHKYYIFFRFKSNSDKVGLSTDGVFDATTKHSGSGEFERKSTISPGGGTKTGWAIGVIDTRSSGWDEVIVDYFGVIDLTETFGAGSEPNLPQMDKLLNQFPNQFFDGTQNLFLAKTTFQNVTNLEGRTTSVETRTTTLERRTSTLEEQFSSIDPSILNTSKEPLTLSTFPISANGINNSLSFIQDNLTIFNGNQYAVWVDGNQHAYVGKRRLPNGEWQVQNISTLGVLIKPDVKRDEHNVFAIGVDSNGYIHVAGDMHAGALNYVKSTNPEDITAWVDAGNMTGVNEASVSYPAFVKRNDGRLLFFYRTTIATAVSDYHINIYNTDTKTWSKLVPKLMDGSVTTESPYINHIAVGKDGSIHMAGTFRNKDGGNIDIFYLKSLDGGLTWKKANGSSYTLPITHSNVEIAKVVPINKGLLNQNGLEVDDNNRPHIAYYMMDENNYTNIFHLYHNGTAWVDKRVTSFKKADSIDLSKLQKFLSRPSIFTFRNRVFIIFRANIEGRKGHIRMIEVTPGITQYKDFPVFNLDLHKYEPTFDTQALYQRGELHLMVTPNQYQITEVNTDLTVLDNWDFQFGGVLTIDLNQIDKLKRGEIRIPELKNTRSLIAPINVSKEIKTSAGVVSLQEFGIIPIMNDGGNRLFARLRVRGRSSANTKMVVRLNQDSKTFNSVNYDKEATISNKESAWKPLPASGNGTLKVEVLIELFNGVTTSDAAITGLEIEIAELVI